MTFEEWRAEYRILHSNTQDDIATARDAWEAARKRNRKLMKSAYLDEPCTVCGKPRRVCIAIHR